VYYPTEEMGPRARWSARPALAALAVVLAIGQAPVPAHAESIRAVKTVAGIPALMDMLYDPGRNLIYGSDYAGGRVLALNGTTGQIVAQVDFGASASPEGLDLSPDGSTLA